MAERAGIEKRLVFTITTGRSGTEYLARALALFRGVKSVHEPKPRFSAAFRAVLAEPEVAREFWLDEKLPAIAHSDAAVWAETSHLACKGFLESLVELGYRPDLVHLHRDARAIALSLWSLRTVPGRTLRGVKYYISPWDPNVLPVRELRREAWHDYQLCYWYCLEIAERARRYRALFEPMGMRIVDVDLASIQSEAGIVQLGSELALGGLSPFGRLRVAHLVNARVNSKDDQKRRDSLHASELDAWEAEVRARVH